eukprot:NODE_5445_length_653_cov_15.731939_g5281_i0.p1 GENE.NODE_5445_length_653_cov_15.731939_g5281_i0~~NODE_5445_length_653_cov_15.731939_g5281_i0.p1  ORF type:complete len:189 (-),score=44.80 NODE_5445_length_653_cov_15.731939_g5281_i0:87-593(-)
MRIHTSHKFGKQPPESICFKKKHFADLQFFAALVANLHRQGVQVAIATFGRRSVVLRAMAFAFGRQSYFTASNISTPVDHSKKEGSGSLGDKNTQLLALSARFDVPPSNILFCDDTERNVRHARKLGITAFVAKPLNATTWANSEAPGWCRQRGIKPLHAESSECLIV